MEKIFLKKVFQIEKSTKETENISDNSSSIKGEQIDIVQTNKKRKDDPYIPKHPYKKRKSKLELSGKNYLCDICYKCYLSYAACYMHLIKKHNMSSTELKFKICKISLNLAKRKKLTSKEIINSLISGDKIIYFSKFSEYFLSCFEEIYQKNTELYSTFIINKYNSYEIHPLYRKINQMKYILEENLDKSPINLIKSIDDSLAIFYFGNSKFLNSSENINLLKNLILFREGANFLGWEYIEIYKKYKIIPTVNYTGDYCSLFMPEDIPQITDDYLSGYLNFDSNFPIKKVHVALFIIDFCNFLFETDLTNYKVEPINY